MYEIPSAAHDWYHDLLNRELSAFPDLMTPWHHRTERLRSERSARRAAELALADHVVVYSSHVIDSYRSLGVDVSRFHAIPLGSPPISAHSLSTAPPQGPIRLVFAGTFGIRKGAHYLIQALESLPKGMFHLDIYGSFALSDSWRARTAAVADWKGPVSFDVLQQAIRYADALILPSLSEAFGMVVTEALAQGTPVIVSEAVGAADLIEPGRSGFMVQSASTQSIVDCLMRLDASRSHWSDYRQHARSAASHWQWRDHGNALVNLMGRVARP
ncbi:MAG: glycosyltransferase [Ahniella sp.]|nr:glycosyltransferase [Ahniella sp.]